MSLTVDYNRLIDNKNYGVHNESIINDIKSGNANEGDGIIYDKNKNAILFYKADRPPSLNGGYTFYVYNEEETNKENKNKETYSLYFNSGNKNLEIVDVPNVQNISIGGKKKRKNTKNKIKRKKYRKTKKNNKFKK